jgi:hypothetical protein
VGALARVGFVAFVVVSGFAGAAGLEDALAGLFVPRRGLVERFQVLRQDMSARFPFSVAMQLREATLSLREADAEGVLGGSIGPIPLPSGSAIAPLFTFIRDGMGLVILVSTLVWLVNRVAPQLRL